MKRVVLPFSFTWEKTLNEILYLTFPSICINILFFILVGILWTGVEQETMNQKSYKDTLQTAVHEEARLARDEYHVVLKNRTPKLAVRYDRIMPSSQNEPHGKSPQVVVGSILHSTDKLLNVHLFDRSTILIVNADRSTGFQGLIINKQISWDSLRELEDRKSVV